MIHSEIGASGMHRWSKCPGSVRQSKGLPNYNSEEADEGTCAHGLAEVALKFQKIPLKTYLNTVRIGGERKFTVGDEMIQGVKLYADTVLGYVKAADDVLFVEVQFNLSAVHPGLFGTADAVVWSPSTKTLYVIDLKYGAGLPVDVKNNVQLKYYALGALLQGKYPAEKVVMVIVQPRCEHPDGPVRTDELDIYEMLAFDSELKEYAVATEKPDAPLSAGTHCRWCRAARVPGACPELERQQAELVAMEFPVVGVTTDFTPALAYDPVKLSKGLVLADTIEAKIKLMREFAYQEACAGRTPPGWKIVAKRAQRHWKNEGEAAGFVTDVLGLSVDDVMTPSELRSPAQVEKLLKKKDRELLDGIVVKKSSGNTLVPESDTRPAALSGPENEFDVVTE